MESVGHAGGDDVVLVEVDGKEVCRSETAECHGRQLTAPQAVAKTTFDALGAKPERRRTRQTRPQHP